MKSAKRCMGAAHPLAFVDYVRRVAGAFGTRFVLMMFSTYFLLKGALYSLVLSVQLPYFKALGLDGLFYQTSTAASMAPWAMKGLIGAVSDAYPLFGYYKKYYMLIASALGTAAVVALAVVPMAAVKALPWVAALLFFCMHMQMAVVDLLVEGKYAERMVQRPETKSDCVTFVWLCCTIGMGLGSCIVGPLSDSYGPVCVLYVCVFFAAQSIVPTAMGYLPEEKVPAKLEVSKLKKQGRIFGLAVLMAAAALGLAAVGLTASYLVSMVYSIVASVVLGLCGFFCLPRTLALANIYLFLQSTLYIDLAGALDFWYTAGPDCVANGPAFDFTYYSTYTQLIAMGGSSLGLWVFQSFLSDWPFRKVFWISTCLKIVSSIFDLIIVKRWNVLYGVNDHWAYILGDAIIAPVCVMLNWMPSIVLVSKLCPKNVESTMYAILAGYDNFGHNVAKSVGVYLTQHFNVQTVAPSCNFDSLPTLILIGHFAVPFLCIPLTFLLLPDKKMSDNLLEHEQDAPVQDDKDKKDTSDAGDDETRTPPQRGASTEALGSLPDALSGSVIGRGCSDAHIHIQLCEPTQWQEVSGDEETGRHVTHVSTEQEKPPFANLDESVLAHGPYVAHPGGQANYLT